MQITANLKALITAHQIDQSELAKEVGVSREQVSRWVNGHHVPDGANLIKLIQALRAYDTSLSLDDLLQDPPRNATGEA